MREVKILIPDIEENESVDIRVVSKGVELVSYRLDILKYPKGETKLSRADFVKNCIDQLDKKYVLIEVGLEGELQIPILLRQKEVTEE